MPRRILIIAWTTLLLVSSHAWAEDAEPPTVDVSAGFSSQSLTVEAKGAHNVADSATLRDHSCQGYVDAAPAVIVRYDAEKNDGALAVEARGRDGLVLLIGTASNTWHCTTDDDASKRPSLELPKGSGDFSVWVGTREKEEDSSAVTLTIEEHRAKPVQTACGADDATRPESVPEDDWSNYTCAEESDAGAAWDSCHAREAYTETPARGCPGAQRCCPPVDDAPSSGTSSDDKTDTPAASEKPETTPSDGDDDEDAFAEYARPPVGTVASGAPDQLIFETTPYGRPSNPLIVQWRGFAETEFPVRATTTHDGETMFTLLGKDFPQEVTDSLLIVLKARTLRAKENLTLPSKKGESLSLKKGDNVELLARIGRDQCALRTPSKKVIATCPKSTEVDDTSGPYHGWSPLAYEWWIAIEDEDNQRGWLHIDLTRPEFAIESKK